MFTRAQLKERIEHAHRKMDKVEEANNAELIQMYGSLLREYYEQLRLAPNTGILSAEVATQTSPIEVGSATKSAVKVHHQGVQTFSLSSVDSTSSSSSSSGEENTSFSLSSSDGSEREHAVSASEAHQSQVGTNGRKRPRSVSPDDGGGRTTGVVSDVASSTQRPVIPPPPAQPAFITPAQQQQIKQLETHLPKGFTWEWSRYHRRYVCMEWKSLSPRQYRDARIVSYRRRLLFDPDEVFFYAADFLEDALVPLANFEVAWCPETWFYTTPTKSLKSLMPKQLELLKAATERRQIFEALRWNGNFSVAGIERYFGEFTQRVTWNAAQKVYSGPDLSDSDKESAAMMTDLRRALLEAEEVAGTMGGLINLSKTLAMHSGERQLDRI